MDNSGKEKEAIQLMADADKKVKSSGSFLGGMFGGGHHKVEEACEMYCRAANMFKMAKNWSAAGNAFCKAARLHMQLQNKHDCATSFIDAGNAFKKSDPNEEAIKCLNAAIDIYTDMGRFTIAAKHHISIAEIYESEMVDIEKVTYNPNLHTYSLCYSVLGLGKRGASDSPQIAIEKYEEMFPAFSDSRECKLLKKLLEAHEEQNSDAFTEAVKEFDSISRLDQWHTTLLLRIKKTIQGDEGDLK
uniref:N-ethylmaleimide-sensitive factor attachment protein, beta b n=1 Tax=Tetraodon nigroviridis TaxID=99883 RepID=H3CZF6_TETNG